jgi:alpha-N-acetylglucosaminidase
MGRSNPNMLGTALFTAGMDTNPFAFDLFTGMAWRNAPVDLAQWTADYVRQRYGAADAHALAAWKILLDTAYNIRIDKAEFNSERDAALESLFNAQPSLTTHRASHGSPEAMRYDPQAFARALPEMLQLAPAQRGSESYQYDLVDIARQTLANQSRLLLPQIRTACDTKDRARFEALTARWLQLMRLQDRLLASNRSFLLGSWLARVPAWAASPDELARLNHDARSILATWGERKASEGAELHDDGNKDRASLTGDYYLPRWQRYFASLDTALRTGQPAKPIDGYTFGDALNHATQRYATEAEDDPHAIATAVAKTLHLLDEHAAESPSPQR